jgi:hypothetical protein
MSYDMKKNVSIWYWYMKSQIMYKTYNMISRKVEFYPQSTQ